MPNIIDIIHHTAYPFGKPYIQVFVVVDVRPHLLYERRGNLLVGDDDGFYNCFKYERPGATWKAFAGREFDIEMKDGSIEHAYGQWWDYWGKDIVPESTYSIGVGTPESLWECNVFSSYHVSTAKYNAWLSNHKPSTYYEKYGKRGYPYRYTKRPDHKCRIVAEREKNIVLVEFFDGNRRTVSRNTLQRIGIKAVD